MMMATIEKTRIVREHIVSYIPLETGLTYGFHHLGLKPTGYSGSFVNPSVAL
jgi:hypothetical protein